MPSTLKWFGNEIALKLEEKLIVAIDACTEAARQDAVQNHWWSNRTGDLEANTISKPAKAEGLLVKGAFGSSMRQQGFYGLFLERQTPWLRPAADRQFRLLPLKLKAMLRWM